MWRASSQRFVQACIGLSLVASLTACGGSGGGGGAGGEVAALLGYKSAEGTLDAPLNLGTLEGTGVVLHEHGTVATGGLSGPSDSADSYYLVQGISPGVEYVVTMANLTDNADLYLFQGDPTFKKAPLSHISTGTATETFTVLADSDVTSFFISIDGFNTAKGAEYDLSVIVKPQSEGSIATPIELGSIGTGDVVARGGSKVGHTNTCCGIQATGDSYYHVHSAYSSTLISLNQVTDDVDLYVYTDTGFSALVCSSQKLGTAIETCSVTGSGDYYIAVDGYAAAEGAAYQLNVIQKPIGTQACGSLGGSEPPGNPIDGGSGKYNDICYMGEVPQLLRVDNSHNRTSVLPGGAAGILPINPFAPPQSTDISSSTTLDSYYRFDNATPGTLYRLALEDATDNAQLYVYDRDTSYTTPVSGCHPPYPNPKIQECIFTATSHDVYFAVDGFNTVAGAAFSISILPAFLGEGSAASPVDLGDADNGDVVADLDHIHKVLKDDDIGIAGDKDSYYKTTVTPGQVYIVSLPAMTDDVDLYVFNGDSTFTNLECAPYLGGTSPEKCAVTATGTTLYFAVDGYFTKAGAAYLIEVTPGNGKGEGSTTVAGDSPLDLGSIPVGYFGYAIGTGTQEDSDLIDETDDLTDSFYQVAVDNTKTYRVSLTDLSDDLDLFVFDSDFSTLLCASRNSGAGVSETCLASPTGATMYVVVDGSWAVAGQAVNLRLSVEERQLPAATTMTVGQTLTNEAIDWGPDYGIGGDNDKYYKVTTLTPGSTYKVRISNLTDDLDLYVFSDDQFSVPITCTVDNTYLSGLVDESCTFVAPAATVYFAVDGAWMYLDYSATYDISLTAGP